VSLGLLTAGLISPWVGRAIARQGGRPRPRSERRVAGERPAWSGVGAVIANFSDGLAGDRIRNGRGPLRSGLCHPRPILWSRRTLCDYDADAVRRVRQHDMLAPFGVPRCASGMARRLSGLRGLPTCCCAACLSLRPAGRIPATRVPARFADFAGARAGAARFPRRRIISSACRDHHAEFGDLEQRSRFIC
jgi:hypothetical protein